jgi:hypothetical protein
MTRVVYAVESWALFAFGVLHSAATPSRYSAVSSGALWFFSGGVLIMLVATLNLLNRTYGAGAPGLRRVCVAANVVNLGLAVVGGVVGHARLVEWVIVLAIVVPLTILSALPRASRVKGSPGVP